MCWHFAIRLLYHTGCISGRCLLLLSAWRLCGSNLAGYCRRHQADNPDVPDFTAAEAKEHLYCMVINAEDNAEWLSHSPHEQMQDLAVIAYYRLDDSATIRVTNEMCPYLQMTGEEVLEAAHKNTNKQEYRLETLEDVLDRMIPYNIQEPNEMEEKAYVPDQF